MTTSRPATAPSHEADILDRAIRGKLSEDAGRSLLELELSDMDKDRVNELAAEARERSLSPEERSELDDYERIASLLELLQSKARLFLKNNPLGPSGAA
jgi:hypothetical protein